MKNPLNRLSPRGLRIYYTVVSLLVLGVCTLNFSYVMVFNATANDQCAWRVIPNRTDALLITDVVEGGVADVAGIKNGDLLLKINGTSFEGINAQSLINSVPNGEYATYLVGRNGSQFETKIQILRVFSITSLALYLLGLGFLIVGYVVVMTKPKGHIQRLFAKYSILALLLFGFFGPPQQIPDNRVLTTFFIVCLIAAFVLTPPMFLRFFFHFPVRRKILDHKWVTPALYVLSTVVTILIPLGNALKLPGWMTTALFLSPYGAYLSGLAVFIHSYFSLVEPARRSQFRPILIGVSIGGGAALFIAAVAINNPFTLFLKPLLFIPGLLIIAVPISFGYSIFKYRLMDIDLIVKRSLFYGAVTATIAAIYLLTVYGVGAMIAYFIGSEENSTLNVVALVVIALAFDPLKRRIEGGIDRLFYRERRNYQKALLEFSRELPQQINLEQILRSMITRISSTMHVERVAVVICDETEGCAAHAENIDLSCCDFDQRDGGLMSLLRQTRAPQSLALLAEEPESLNIHARDREKIITSGIVLAVPMFLKDRLVGSIHVGLKMSGKIYSQEDIDLLSTVGSQAAIAIENARLHLAEIEKQRIEEEVKLAWKIQQGLLPKSEPKIAGLDIAGTTVPARTVGGDYFDYIQLGPRKVMVVVADVSGKGMSAALYMSKVQGMVQLAAQVYTSPRDILVHVNRQLYHGIERNSFITMIIALFDLDKRELVLCRAGHNKALISSNGSMKFLDANGIGLGLEQGLIFEKQLEEIRQPLTGPGLYVFYSDGLTEAMNEQRTQFGEEAVYDLVQSKRNLGARELHTSLLDAVRDFQGKAEQHDDLTLVVVKTS